MADSRAVAMLACALAVLGATVMWAGPHAEVQAYASSTLSAARPIVAGQARVATPTTSAPVDSVRMAATQQDTNFVQAQFVPAQSTTGAPLAFGAVVAGVTALATYFYGRSRSAVRLPLLPIRSDSVALAASTGEIDRRQALIAAGAGWALAASPAFARPETLLDEEMLAKLDSIPRVKTPSGLEYQDVVVGKGPSPQPGYQVTFNLVSSLPNGKVFTNSVKNNQPLDLRVGSNSLQVQGLDEGLLTMKEGGIRRLYIPGSLSYQTPLKAAPGSPAIPAKSPIIMDVQLLLVPGLESEEDSEGVFNFEVPDIE